MFAVPDDEDIPGDEPSEPSEAATASDEPEPESRGFRLPGLSFARRSPAPEAVESPAEDVTEVAVPTDEAPVAETPRGLPQPSFVRGALRDVRYRVA